LPTALVEGRQGLGNVAKGFAKAQFFVEGWDDGGDFQKRQNEDAEKSAKTQTREKPAAIKRGAPQFCTGLA
jgi:hypothetical protein